MDRQEYVDFVRARVDFTKQKYGLEDSIGKSAEFKYRAGPFEGQTTQVRCIVDSLTGRKLIGLNNLYDHKVLPGGLEQRAEFYITGIDDFRVIQE